MPSIHDLDCRFEFEWDVTLVNRGDIKSNYVGVELTIEDFMVKLSTRKTVAFSDELVVRSHSQWWGIGNPLWGCGFYRSHKSFLYENPYDDSLSGQTSKNVVGKYPRR